jgi:hypothetical protein
MQLRVGQLTWTDYSVFSIRRVDTSDTPMKAPTSQRKEFSNQVRQSVKDMPIFSNGLRADRKLRPFNALGIIACRRGRIGIRSTHRLFRSVTTRRWW